MKHTLPSNIYIFPAEAAANELEVQIGQRFGEYHKLHPEIVALLDDTARIKLFALALAYKLIVPKADEQGRVWLEVVSPQNEIPVHRTRVYERSEVEFGAESLLFEAIRFFTRNIDEARSTEMRSMWYDEVKAQVAKIEQLLSTQSRVDCLQQEITAGSVARLLEIGREKNNQQWSDLARVLELMLLLEINSLENSEL